MEPLDMGAVERKTTIQAPPEAVWALLADGDNWSQWEPDIVEVLSQQGGVQEGGSLRVRLKPGFRATISFVEVEAPRRLVCKTSVSNGMMTAHGVFELTPVRGGAATDVSYTLAMGGPVGVILCTFAPNKVAHEAQVSLDNLAQLTRAG